MSVLGKYLKWLKENKDEGSKKNPYLSEISAWLKKFGLREYDLHAWFAKTANTAFPKCMNIDIVQKLATNLYSALKKVIFSSGKNIHYRKFGQTNSIEGKRNQNAIIYHPKTDTVRFAKKEIKIQPIRAKDFYMQEALATGSCGTQ